jgi:hypothetical protein
MPFEQLPSLIIANDTFFCLLTDLTQPDTSTRPSATYLGESSCRTDGGNIGPRITVTVAFISNDTHRRAAHSTRAIILGDGCFVVGCLRPFEQ